LIILGIDPGTIICGYGLIEKDNRNMKVIEYGVIHAKVKALPLPDRLKEIYLRLTEVIIRNKPDIAVLESAFYSKNVQSLMKLSHARGVAVLSAAINGVEVAEYSPREVKKSVTGKGNAQKEQVQFMVKRILNIDETPEFFDVTDALAVALCHAYKNEFNFSAPSSWEDYIKKNPERVIKP
jgi:crossover junction endodeoxyribonuclease RuvC